MATAKGLSTRRPTTTARKRPSPSRSRSAPARRRRSAPTPPLARLGGFLASQPDDLWGSLLLVGGVLLALGIYGNVACLVGSALRRVGGMGVGVGDATLPPALIAGGATLIFHRARRGIAGELTAAGVLAVATAALADLTSGRPGVHAARTVLEHAGGIVGAALGSVLHRYVGTAGATVVLAAFAVPAVCGLAGLTLRGAAEGSAHGASAVARALSLLFAARETAVAPPATRAVRIDPAPAYRVLTPSELVPEHSEPPEHQQQPEVALAPEASMPAGDLEVSPTSQEALETEPAGRAEQLGLGVVATPGPWRLPSLRLLGRSDEQSTDQREVDARGRILEAALRSHGVETRLVGSTVGPTVTRFELELAAGVKVARVTSLAKDIAYAMASPDVRILAPIPGRSAIGVEVPNVNRQLVTLGDVLSSYEARSAHHPLEVALGRDIAGRAVMVNLAEMPHLLIAGATGAGKSSCINSLVTSVLMRSTPEEVRLILVDPKRVELGQYNSLPHLLTQVVVNPKRAANALAWAVTEMERRYDLLAEAGMRDITGYNAAVDRGDFAPGPFDPGLEGIAPDDLAPDDLAPDDLARDDAFPMGTNLGDEEPFEDLDDERRGSAPEAEPAAAPQSVVPLRAVLESAEAERRAKRFAKLPFILIVVDELNDLMMVAARDVEESICRIAQMARAVGIHLVIATQRPSVDVITGVIKANIPSRLAFSVSSLADSRVILDQPGAERLVGRGDLLLLTASSSVPRRIQSPWVSEDEVHTVVSHWRRQAGAQYLDGVAEVDGEQILGVMTDDADDDALLPQAMELVVRSQLGSTSMLQRKLRVGFARAGRIMDLLERRGVVGPSEGSKARAVLMAPDELDQLQR